MTIQDLIAEKRKQIGVLERHIRMLQEMAREEAGNGPTARASRTNGTASRQGRRRGSTSRAAMVEAYLRSHSGPQPAREMAVALGLKAAQLHGAINSGLKTGRFVRGSQRATFALGSERDKGSSPRRKKVRARRRSAPNVNSPGKTETRTA